jgi:hypothetical protein
MFRREKEETERTFKMDALMCSERSSFCGSISGQDSKAKQDIPDSSTDASSRRQLEEASYQHVAEMMSRCEISPICRRK